MYTIYALTKNYNHPAIPPSPYKVQFGALFLTTNKSYIADSFSCIQKQQAVKGHREFIFFCLFAEVKDSCLTADELQKVRVPN